MVFPAIVKAADGRGGVTRCEAVISLRWPANAFSQGLNQAFATVYLYWVPLGGAWQFLQRDDFSVEKLRISGPQKNFCRGLGVDI